MSDERFRVMSNEVKQWYCIESAEGEMFSNQEVADLLTSLSSKNMQLHHTNKELEKENEELRKERDYWEQSSKHRQRLLEDSEKELRLHNAYLIDNNQAEDYQRWRRSNK